MGQDIMNDYLCSSQMLRDDKVKSKIKELQKEILRTAKLYVCEFFPVNMLELCYNDDEFSLNTKKCNAEVN